MATPTLSFCDNCQPSANRLMDEKINAQKQQNEILQRVSTEIHDLKNALQVANKKCEVERNDSLRLKTENERLQKLVTRAESNAEGSFKQTKDALDLAKDRIKQLEDQVLGLKKSGKRVQTTAMMTGATAMVGSAICAAISRTMAAVSLVGFGAGSFVNMVVVHITGKATSPKKTEERKEIINTDAIMGLDPNV